MLRTLQARREHWPLAAPFRISRGVKTAADVVAVDTAANTVTVRGPGGNVVTLDVFREELRARLGTLKAGDLLRTTFTEAVAVNIRPASQ